MDGLFELIIFALFLLASFAGGRRKKKGGEGGDAGAGTTKAPRRGRRGRTPTEARERSPRAGTTSSRAGTSGAEASGPGEREPAAEMVPDDLWGILTGERPSSAPTGSGHDENESGDDGREGGPAWSSEAGARTSSEAAAGRSAGSSRAGSSRDASGGGADITSEPAPVPAGAAGERPGWDEEARSLETIPARGEAQSLETIPEREEPRVVSLEQEPLPPEVRRKLTLERIRNSSKRRSARRSGRRRRLPLGLEGRGAIQRAFVLRDVLGPPKGLQ